MSEDRLADALGMTEGELYGYLNDLLHEEAAEAAAESGKSIEEELDSAGFTAAEAANTYAIKLILANNAFITRQLLDLGVLQTGDGAVIE
jgi:AraC-like DNA-binding protein